MNIDYNKIKEIIEWVEGKYDYNTDSIIVDEIKKLIKEEK